MAEHLTAETLCDRISREVLRHGIDWNDGDPRCYCGGPLPESWDQHLAEALAGVFAPELTELATRTEQAEAERDDLRARLTGVAIHAGRLSSRYDDPHGTTEMGQVLGDLLAAVGAKNMTEAAAVEAERDALQAAIERVREVRDQWALTSASPDDSPDSRLRTQLYADVVGWLDAALDAPEATTERTDLIGAYATHLHVAGDRTDAAEAVIERIHRAIVDVYGEDYDGEDVAAEVERLLAYLSEHGANVRRILQAKNEAIERAQATIDRVRGVHVVNDLGECVDCRASWPCPTIAVLDAPETPGDAEEATTDE